MAITDLLTRIEGDAADEAAAIMTAARAEADRIIERAEATTAAERAAAMEAAARSVAAERETLLANARLTARDELLARKRQHAERVLERAREALAALPDGEYLELIASAVARATAGGETLRVAPDDAVRLSGLAERLAEAGVDVSVSGDPAPIERGVLLAGDRVRVEISPATLIADSRDRLLLVASRTLFGSQG